MKDYTLAELAEITASQLVGDPHYRIKGVEQLDAAGPDQAAFLENPRYEKNLKTSHAGVILVQPSRVLENGKNFLLHIHPSLAFQKIIELFLFAPPTGFSGVHPTAIVHDTVLLEPGVSVGPHAVIDQGVKIGSHTTIGAGCYIGAATCIGSKCLIHPRVTVRENCILGNRVVLQPGAVIGSCGFGYHTDEKGHHHPLKQLGRVIIEDDVEIGANTTIDRARFTTTRIRRGTKIDNLVQIAHSVEIGEENLVVSQTGIAGSTKTGKHVIMGGQVGINGHIEITDSVIIAARGAVSKSLTKPGIYSGAPAEPIREFNTHLARLRGIEKLYQRVKDLETHLLPE